MPGIFCTFNKSIMFEFGHTIKNNGSNMYHKVFYVMILDSPNLNANITA